MSDILVRASQEDEWQVLRDVRLASLRSDPTAFLSSAEGEEADPEQLWRLRTHFRAIAWNGDDPVGVIGWARHDGYLEIVGLWVDPDERGTDVAARLTRFVLERIAGPSEDVRLAVIPTNGRARRFYERVGFEVMGERAHPHAGQLTWMALRRQH